MYTQRDFFYREQTEKNWQIILEGLLDYLVNHNQDNRSQIFDLFFKLETLIRNLTNINRYAI